MRRLLAGGTAWLALFGGAAFAQTYPTTPDGSHSSVPAPYPTQGPLPELQESRPGAEADGHAQAAPGVDNGLSAPLEVKKHGRYVAEGNDLRPTTRPSPRTSIYAVREKPIEVAPGLRESDFHPSPDLPDGVRMDVTRIDPTGGVEYWLLAQPGSTLPLHVADTGRELTVYAGQGEVRIDERAPQAAEPHSRFLVGAGVSESFACAAPGARCLVKVHTDGPQHLRYLGRPAGEP